MSAPATTSTTARQLFNSSVSSDERVKALRYMDSSTLSDLISAPDYGQVQDSVKKAAESRLRRIQRESLSTPTELPISTRKAC